MNYYNIERSSCIENLSTESESGVELCVCKNKIGIITDYPLVV